MQQSEFMSIVDKTFADLKRILDKKRKHREGKGATDRLMQFKMAAAVRQTHPASAVAGMMVKHDTQLYTMIDEAVEGNESIPMAQWRETIYDSINYRLLLLAALSEDLEDN